MVLFIPGVNISCKTNIIKENLSEAMNPNKGVWNTIRTPNCQGFETRLLIR